MPVPTVITDLSTTAASNSPAGPDAVFPNLDDYLRALSAFIAQNYADKLPKAGGTMTGPLALSGAPTVDLHAATKKYVDDADASLAPKASPVFTGAAQFDDGTAAAPAVAFSGDTDTGLYRSGANTLAFSTGGSYRGHFSASGGLWVGNDNASEASSGPGTIGSYVSAGNASVTRYFVSGVGEWWIGQNGSTNAIYVGSGTGLTGSQFGFGPSLFTAVTDNSKTLGGAATRWSVVYAVTGSINTSDAREKTAVRPLTGPEIEAAKALAKEIGSYRWLEAIDKKGDGARDHIGLTVQRAIEVMESFGLDPMRYGFICYDAWTPEGGGAQQDRYSFRTDELLLFLARGFDARLSALEA